MYEYRLYNFRNFHFLSNIKKGGSRNFSWGRGGGVKTGEGSGSSGSRAEVLVGCPWGRKSPEANGICVKRNNLKPILIYIEKLPFQG